mmetsp:Transcript_4484/g.11827  ORF Transcript_4484/g.11827 Transcript_4484/m.11827 type:complete len:220 (-) Transcript_4484:1200-1859(-)
MRLRAEVNSRTSRISKEGVAPVNESFSVTVECCLSTNSMPKKAAADTSAASSGDDAEKRFSLPTCSMTTVWQSARRRRKSRHLSRCSTPASPRSAAKSSGPSNDTGADSFPPPAPLAPVPAQAAPALLCGPLPPRAPSGGSRPSRARRARPISVLPCPYETPLIEHFRNCITFCVSVPVLSEKTCDTQPSSSMSCIVRTLSFVPDSAWKKARSFSMTNL